MDYEIDAFNKLYQPTYDNDDATMYVLEIVIIFVNVPECGKFTISSVL